LAENEIANIKMNANIRLLQKRFMIGRPAVEAGSLFYNKSCLLSDQGIPASELQMEFEYIECEYNQDQCTHGDTNDL
jgi:hypothetical protein